MLKAKHVSIRITLITVVSIFAMLLFAEFLLRRSTTYIILRKAETRRGFVESRTDSLIMYTNKGKRLVPNAHCVIRNHYLSKRDILMDVNSLGFRGEEIPKDKKDNELRIIVFGDSITCANYLSADEVYVERIEKYLNESMNDRTVNVINGGIEDIGLKEEVDILEERVSAVKPDIVVIGFYLNDSRPPWGFSKELLEQGWLRRKSRLADRIYYKLKLWSWIKDKGDSRFLWIPKVKVLDWANNREDFLELASLAKYDWGSLWEGESAESWKVVQREFGRLKLLSEQNNFDVAVVVFPVSFQVDAEFIEETPQRILKHKVTGLGFRYFDLLSLLRNHKDDDLYFDHCHPKKDANDLIGKAIADFLKEEM